DGYATLERAEELELRIKKLVFVLVNKLQGKRKKEIPSKVLADIEMLKRFVACWPPSRPTRLNNLTFQ
ncbi:hypothetical protein C0991_002150, partial [Blastosporella zonata]